MHREAGNSKAAGNAMLAQHGIAGQPLAEALGQYLGLFGACLRHQDDELIAAVARNHVRLPGLLLKQAAHTGEHKIPLEMTHRVVDLFEFVEIDKHD